MKTSNANYGNKKTGESIPSLNLAPFGRYTATPNSLRPPFRGARLVRFERGGHLLLGVEQTTIRTIMQKHIVRHMRE